MQQEHTSKESEVSIATHIKNINTLLATAAQKIELADVTPQTGTTQSYADIVETKYKGQTDINCTVQNATIVSIQLPPTAKLTQDSIHGVFPAFAVMSDLSMKMVIVKPFTDAPEKAISEMVNTKAVADAFPDRVPVAMQALIAKADGKNNLKRTGYYIAEAATMTNMIGMSWPNAITRVEPTPSSVSFSLATAETYIQNISTFLAALHSQRMFHEDALIKNWVEFPLQGPGTVGCLDLENSKIYPQAISADNFQKRAIADLRRFILSLALPVADKGIGLFENIAETNWSIVRDMVVTPYINTLVTDQNLLEVADAIEKDIQAYITLGEIKKDITRTQQRHGTN